jgi:hypothetical protein
MSIRTGDGETFLVHTLPSYSLEEEYHETEYELVDIDLPLIKKRKLKRREFPLEFYFIGDNHLSESFSFRFSAGHPDPWEIQHPYYDFINCQVTQLKFDDIDLNITKVTCIAKETILDGTQVKFIQNQSDVIQLKSIAVEQAITSDTDITGLSIKETQTLKQTTTKNYNSAVKIIKDPVDAENYYNAFSKANAAINNLTHEPVVFMREITSLILAPYQFNASVKDKIRILNNQYANFRATLTGLTTSASKKLYQLMVSGNISATCNAAATPTQTGIGPVISTTFVQSVQQLINTNYRQFRNDLGSLQGLNGGNALFFIPNFDVNQSLNDIVTFTTSALIEIALNGRKEIRYTLTEDSNVILLTHRFYGLDPLDNNIQNFIQQNKIRYKEIALGLPKGREIVYYA